MWAQWGGGLKPYFTGAPHGPRGGSRRPAHLVDSFSVRLHFRKRACILMKPVVEPREKDRLRPRASEAFSTSRLLRLLSARAAELCTHVFPAQ